jgi:hypothetical protein
LPGIRFSSVYRTAPRHVTDQEEFLNAVAIIQTDQTPDAIASTLRTIEHALKKEPPFRFGPRKQCKPQEVISKNHEYGNETYPRPPKNSF